MENLMRLKRQKDKIERKMREDLRENLASKIWDFTDKHRMRERLFQHYAIDSRAEKSRRNLSPDTNEARYDLSRLDEINGNETNLYRLGMNGGCLCGCNTKESYVGVFEFESEKIAKEMGELIKNGDHYYLYASPMRVIESAIKSNKDNLLLDMHIRFGGFDRDTGWPAYDNEATACGLKIDFEGGKLIHRKLCSM